ncbi:MAG: UDP-N-acetylmuramoyl-L-alanyl-D-glutamate--2,6-diaminopimelate ligase [Fimbriimonas sp.]
MTFRECLREANVMPPFLNGDANVTSIEMDSRRITPGALFVCMPGFSADPHQFLAQAKASGATAALVHSPDGLRQSVELGLAVAFVDARPFPKAVWRLAREITRHPSRNMQVFGITGTNGKTTVAWLLRDLLAQLGKKSAYLGTLGFQTPETAIEIANTTPFSVELHHYLAEARDQGVDALALEISSHALAQMRADGVELDAAIFTNLTQDHLDFHETMEAYEAAKWRLFEDFPAFTSKKFHSVISADDPVGRSWTQTLRQEGREVLTWGREDADVVVVPHKVGLSQLDLEFLSKELSIGRTLVSLGGDYNVSNTVTAVAALIATGYSPEEVVLALPNVRPVPGRFESLPNEAGIEILIDYAHTPDALEKLLDTVRALAPGRVTTVFGCGGDRDRTKRPQMARVASERSDLTVITSDNPRTEDPSAILAEVAAGLQASHETAQIEDRGEAIRYAIQQSRPGDVVVIAGKGHENYQIIGHDKIPMDDRILAREALKEQN